MVESGGDVRHVTVAPEIPETQYCPACETSFTGRVERHCPRDGARLVVLSARRDPLLGRTLAGRYTLHELLGRGGMGAVYRATQHGLGRQVAVKVVHPELLADGEVIKRFLREAKLCAELGHPNAVAVLDFGQTRSDRLFYLVMERLVGDTLEELLAREGPLPAARIAHIGMQICDLLEAAHDHRIVHRDLKPSNIMVLRGTRDTVKVLDFGLARRLDGGAPDRTAPGALFGTPAYLSPERALGETGDGRSDLYALGCILYELGTGAPPFQAATAHGLVTCHVVEPAPPLLGVPDALAQVVARLLSKDPAGRYASASATSMALELSAL